MSWPLYLIALGVVILGLLATEAAFPRAVGLLVLAIVLSVAILHPTFLNELQALSSRLRGRG